MTKQMLMPELQVNIERYKCLAPEDKRVIIYEIRQLENKRLVGKIVAQADMLAAFQKTFYPDIAQACYGAELIGVPWA